ncbi:MAG: alpha/beta hydrolase [Cyanobacteria bacterium J06623_5]
MGRVLGWLAVGLLFFLSLWIVLPAPNFFWLQLAVGAPEVSPLLFLLSAIALLLFLALYRLGLYPSPNPYLLLLLLAALGLSSLPLLQQPQAVSQARQSLAAAFESPMPSSALSIKPVINSSTFDRSAFSWRTFFVGEPRQVVRHRPKLRFASPDGVPLFLDIYQPETSAPSEASSGDRYPAVVMIYGGGWRTGSSSENAAFGRFLARRGYVAVSIDYRHTPTYRFPAQLEDVKTALSFVRSHAEAYEIDRHRISLMGWSAGAHLAMLAGFQSDAPIRSIVNYYGPVDLKRGYEEPPTPDPLDVRQVLLAFLGGPPSQYPEAYAAASPITYVKAAPVRSLPPVLLIYGGRDHIVEARFGEDLYRQLLKSENKAVWVKIPWAEHAFDALFNGVSNQLALHFVEPFLAETLGEGHPKTSSLSPL